MTWITTTTPATTPTNGPVGYRISAAPFCRHFGISVESTVKFISPEFDGESLLLNLGETISVARPGRRRTKK